MSIGFGIFLFVIGAILVWALDVQVSGVDLTMIGYILMGAGVVIALIGAAALFRRRSSISTQSTNVDPASGNRVTRTEQSIDDPGTY